MWMKKTRFVSVAAAALALLTAAAVLSSPIFMSGDGGAGAGWSQLVSILNAASDRPTALEDRTMEEKMVSSSSSPATPDQRDNQSAAAEMENKDVQQSVAAATAMAQAAVDLSRNRDQSVASPATTAKDLQQKAALPEAEMVHDHKADELSMVPSQAAVTRNGDREAAAAPATESKDGNRNKPARKSPTMVPATACDVFDGSWVFDNATSPIYSADADSGGCPYIADDFACEKWGRKDTKFQQWRWQPHGCDLPRFDAAKLLEKLRGKRMVFVGDSVNRNQWNSMVCLLETHLAGAGAGAGERRRQDLKKTGNPSLMSYRAEEYNATVDFYWTPMLVESNCDDPVNHRVSGDRVILAGAGAMDKHAAHWSGADIAVFNSYIWWQHPVIKAIFGKTNSTRKKKMKKNRREFSGRNECFGLALKAWSDWLRIHWRGAGKQAFFMGSSPIHPSKEAWGVQGGGSCYGETEPIDGGGGYGGMDETMVGMVAEAVAALRKKGVSIGLMNISRMTRLRKDGHPSVYRMFWDRFDTERAANPSRRSDCIHWCLPGVPDVWNQILYHHLISPPHQ